MCPNFQISPKIWGKSRIFPKFPQNCPKSLGISQTCFQVRSPHRPDEVARATSAVHTFLSAHAPGSAGVKNNPKLDASNHKPPLELHIHPAPLLFQVARDSCLLKVCDLCLPGVREILEADDRFLARYRTDTLAKLKSKG